MVVSKEMCCGDCAMAMAAQRTVQSRGHLPADKDTCRGLTFNVYLQNLIYINWAEDGVDM